MGSPDWIIQSDRPEMREDPHDTEKSTHRRGAAPSDVATKPNDIKSKEASGSDGTGPVEGLNAIYSRFERSLNRLASAIL